MTLSTPRSLRQLVLLTALAALLAPASSSAGTTNAGLPDATADNPLAGMTWGAFHHSSSNPAIDSPSAYYNQGRGQDLLAKILDQPRVRWFGGWIPQRTNGSQPGIFDSTRLYIDQVTHGDASIGVQLATFRMDPWEGALRDRLPTGAQNRFYRRWIASMAAAIGDRTRAVIVVQPDGPLALDAEHHSSWPYGLLSYTALTFNALDHTTVYLDAGSADWASPRTAARLLERSGVRHARGFALNVTHFDATRREIAYAKKVVRILAGDGYRDKHAIVNTAQNGRPWTFQQDERAFHTGRVCTSSDERHCVAFGPRPTTHTGTGAVDGLLWIGRPWVNNATVRPLDEILDLVRYSPFLR